MTPRAICFDATGTLIEAHESVGEIYHRVAVAHGIDLPAWRLEDAFRRILRQAPPRGVDGDTVASRRKNELDWWFERIRETFQATDSTAHFDDFPAFAAALFDAYRGAEIWRPRAGIRNMLARFRDLGWSLAVVSNFDHRLPEILEALDLSNFFDVVVIPSKLGSAKPSAAVFEIVSKAFRLPVPSLLYVGDDSRDILDAIANLGLRVFDIHEIEDLEAFPDLVSTAATLPPR